MDLDLDKYKKAWGNQSEETNKVSRVDIYRMAHSKSSSIVKWIFIIGILEFVFVAIINCSFRINPEDYGPLKDNFIGNYMFEIEILSYLIIIYFLIRFYKNYKSISTSDNTKVLMSKILKTRKTVKAYVFINLSFVFVVALITITQTLLKEEHAHTATFYITITIVSIFLIIIIIGLYWLFYQLLYGILLRKLNKNYKELAKLEELN
ncbi:hypothetical protein [Tenacibaculum larymnensis]|uniref:Beta-carotene 15,15'-monooxygenase n=1 Tax=Tenacibaculum larymnensis TaxID=2878201 RepID=A0A9X4EVX9_9FLAO|nr:hypothetical protein [Tenacibaculum larymnensis]MDE1207346.1 hypothetical protein [Tenacibaculum larymnensis]